MMAHELGFNVPLATITNDISSVQSIAKAGQAIGKPLRQAVLAGELERVIFTSRLGSLDDEHAQAISMTPFIVQTEIQKQYDVRVTVVGEQVLPQRSGLKRTLKPKSTGGRGAVRTCAMRKLPCLDL